MNAFCVPVIRFHSCQAGDSISLAPRKAPRLTHELVVVCVDEDGIRQRIKALLHKCSQRLRLDGGAHTAPTRITDSKSASTCSSKSWLMESLWNRLR